MGSNVSSRSLYNLDAALNYLAVGRWMREHKFDVSRRSRRREELFDLVGSRIFDRQVLYLEFGVWKGAATRYWSKLLRNPHSNLHGFDSFEGLPENWTVDMPRGHFSVDGRVPELDDPRVEFFKGGLTTLLPLTDLHLTKFSSPSSTRTSTLPQSAS